MTCANCAANIERSLKKLSGIQEASVNFASERAAVDFIPDVVSIDDIVAAIEKAGYGAILPEESRDGEDAEQIARQAEIRNQTRKLIAGVIFALPLFVLSMSRDFGLIGTWSQAYWVNWLFAVLDKTGTITEGKPTLSDVVVLDSERMTDENLLQLAASVEQGSEHPLGKAIVREAKAQEIKLSDIDNFTSHGGFGVEATVSGKKVRVGKPKWFDSDILTTADENIDRLQAQGKTVMAVTLENRMAGLLAMADQLKSDSVEAIESLHRQRLHVVMLTGDNPKTAKTIAEQVGIDEVHAEVRPEEKSSEVKKIKDSGRRVGMVGDGINDAPALARADVGMAIGTGTDVAIETADVILSSGSLKGIPRTIAVSRQTMGTIRQNLFLAFAYNVLLIPVAAGVLAPFEDFPEMLRHLHPILAALAMAMSSISVVSNSLRLYRAKI